MRFADLHISRACAAIATCLLLGGCADTLRRSDFLSDQAGDAVAANKAIHIVDPWPRESFDPRLPVDGGRVAAPVTRYRSGEAIAPPAVAPVVRTQ